MECSDTLPCVVEDQQHEDSKHEDSTQQQQQNPTLTDKEQDQISPDNSECQRDVPKSLDAEMGEIVRTSGHVDTYNEGCGPSECGTDKVDRSSDGGRRIDSALEEEKEEENELLAAESEQVGSTTMYQPHEVCDSAGTQSMIETLKTEGEDEASAGEIVSVPGGEELAKDSSMAVEPADEHCEMADEHCETEEGAGSR